MPHAPIDRAMKDHTKHPVACRLCGARLPGRDEPRGRPRLYCPAIIRPCKERYRILVELQRRAEAWEAADRPDVAARIRKRAAASRKAWIA